jgi:hypothetical protein
MIDYDDTIHLSYLVNREIWRLSEEMAVIPEQRGEKWQEKFDHMASRRRRLMHLRDALRETRRELDEAGWQRYNN